MKIRCKKTGNIFYVEDFTLNYQSINANLVSAQNRNRLWWSNIRTKEVGLFGEVHTDFPQPEDQGVMLADILEKEVDQKYYLTGRTLDRIMSESPRINADKSYSVTPNSCTSSGGRSRQSNIVGVVNDNGTLRQVEKSNYIDANFAKGMDNHGQRTLAVIKLHQQDRINKQNGKARSVPSGTHGNAQHHTVTEVITHNMMPRNGKGQGGKGHLSKTYGKSYCCDTGQTNAVEIFSAAINGNRYLNGVRSTADGSEYERRVRVSENRGKALTVTQTEKNSMVMEGPTLRRLTPVEVCRLFTLPDNLFKDENGNNIVAESNQYRLLGNGWVMKVVSHIFSFLPELK
jgi:hypothetical protein